MKKLTLTMAGLLCLGAMSAQTILSEDFETGNKGDQLQPVAAGAGWTTVNGYTGTNAKYNWHNYYSDPKGQYTSATITGECCAGVDAPFTYGEGDGVGPREEILLTPELNLDNNYELEFKFRVSPVNHNANSPYDLQVRVVSDDNLAGAETIFSIQNEKMLRESGITVFPIDDWNTYTAKVGLADFKGEKVKLAFVFKMMGETANVAWLDDVVVRQYTPATGPVPSVSLNRIDFGKLYIGEKFYSDVITLTNTGKDGLKITGFDLPEGVGCTLDAETLDLDAYRQTDFRLYYRAATTSATSGNAVIHTNGGDVTIAISASKQFVPEGSTLELFDQYFPPAGWTTSGWGWSNTTLEGDKSVSAGGDFSASYLRSPRLDLTRGGTVEFTYLNLFDDDGAPEYDIYLQLSTDGGNTWKEVWVSDYENGLNKVTTESVDLGQGTDNSYVRWYYPAVETDDEGAYPHSTFFMDRVLLPNLYGADGVPMAATQPTPANNAEEIYPRDIVLTWAPAQFAEGYKLYVGTNAAADDLINGIDLGNVLTYTIPQCDYSTLYRWKVVGYNKNGNCDTATTWKFTTQPDASVSEYPYVENFLTDELPTGWTNQPSENYSRTWGLNNLNPYVGETETYGVFYTMWLNAGDSNSVTTQEFQLPSDDSMQISFIWGDEHPTDLVIDKSGLVKKNNVEPNNGKSELTFSIYVDGEWHQLSNISEASYDGDHKYWINEKIDLTPYKGKKVQFRWTHYSYSGADDGGSITHIVLERILGDKAKFNLSTWNAGKVNYNKSINSGEMFTLLNDGINTLKIKSADFGTQNFSTSLKAGDEIVPDSGLPFSIQFDALQSEAPVEDDLTVEFESGYKMTFPVSGEGLRKEIYYYSFEPNDLDYKWDEDFTMIDADKGPNYSFSSYWVHYSADGMRGAFSVESDSKEDGMYGMMKPVSGTHALVGSSPQNANADNWIISKKLTATESSKFTFWARNWESLQSVLPDPKHNVGVYVSTTGNTNTNDFVQVMRQTEIPFLGDGEWKHYEVDLGAYAGKEIHVALRHTTDSPSKLMFLDDFALENFNNEPNSVIGIEAVSDNAEFEVYTVGGVLVAKGTGASTLSDLNAGMYIVKITEEGSTKVVKILK